VVPFMPPVLPEPTDRSRCRDGRGVKRSPPADKPLYNVLISVKSW
jgi:hypothetical protein